MIKRMIAGVLVLALMLTGMFWTFAEGQSDAEQLNCFTVTSEQAAQVQRYQLANLTDGDETTGAMFQPIENAEIVFSPDAPVHISGAKIAVMNFPGWRNIKEITLTYNDFVADVLEVPDFSDGVTWVESTVSAMDISKITVTVTDVYGNCDSRNGVLSEVQFFGESTGESSGNAQDAQTVHTLKYGKEYTYLTSNSKVTTTENWFDGDTDTHGYLSQLVGGYIVFQFQYPTDVTSFSMWLVANNDWATYKEIEFGYYNETTKYSPRLQYPSPVFDGIVVTAEKTRGKQTFDLSGYDGLKQITHLIVRCNDAYFSPTEATWGGAYEIEIEGVPNISAKPVSEGMQTELVSNPDIIKGWGLLGDGDVDITKPATRLEAADLILRITGEYDKANAYEGTFNFQDADTVPEARNRLSYLFAYQKFGFSGDENGNFMPNAPMEPQAFYKLLLNLLGYDYGVDYTWDTIHKTVRDFGAFGDMLFTEPFTVKDMCNALWEALNIVPKNGDVILAEDIHNRGLMPEDTWKKFGEKFNKQIVETTRTDYPIPDTADISGDFSFSDQENPKEINKYNFMYNACYHYSGVYYGTLPRDNPESRRDAFAEALKNIGAKALRWPGGNTVHYYFMEEGSKKHVDQLFEDAAVFNGARMGGFYDPQDPDDAYYTECWDFLDFCKEYNIDVLMQVNPAYYIDDNGTDDPSDDRVRNVFLDVNTKKDENGNPYTIPGYYDHTRIQEGAEKLRKNLREMKRRGYECYMWEIGNEDHWKDHDGRAYGENQFVQDYFDMCVAYTKVIKEEFPGSTVCIDTFDIPLAIEKGVITKEDAALFDAITDHYPFARWSGPTGEAEKRNAKQFAGNFEHAMEQAWLNRVPLNWGVPQRMITETTTYRFQNWGSSSVEHTFAHALVAAHNIGEAIFDGGWTLTCLHDLESQWLGYLQHNAVFNTGYRYFSREFEGHPNVSEDDIPENYKFFGERYYTNPAGRAMQIMSRHIGGKVLKNSRSNMYRYVAAYATENGGKITITLVNNFNQARPVNIKLSDYRIPAQTVECRELYTEDIFAVMQEDYFEETGSVEIAGNEENAENDAVVMEVKPYSVTQITFSVQP